MQHGDMLSLRKSSSNCQIPLTKRTTSAAGLVFHSASLPVSFFYFFFLPRSVGLEAEAAEKRHF